MIFPAIFLLDIEIIKIIHIIKSEIVTEGEEYKRLKLKVLPFDRVGTVILKIFKIRYVKRQLNTP